MDKSICWYWVLCFRNKCCILCLLPSNIVGTSTYLNPTAGVTNNTGSSELTCATTYISVTATGGSSYASTGGNSLSTADDTLSAPGIYTVTITSTNGCTATSDITISQNTTAPTTGITNNSGTATLTCTITAINVTATGVGTYAWSGGSSLNTAANTFTAPATYTVTVTGANGCTASNDFTISQNTTAPTAGITNNTGTTTLTCTTTTIDVTATGVGTYAWSGGSSLNTAANTFTAPATYTVTVTGANGCTASNDFTISQNTTAPTAGITNNTGTTTLTCTTTTIDVTATGVGTYAWSGGSSLNTAANTFTLPAIYTVTVTGADGCTASDNITISQNTTAPTVGITNNTGDIVITCKTTAISVTATGGGTYVWSGGTTPLTANDSLTTAGIYAVTVTSVNGCTATSDITVSLNNASPNVVITNPASVCSPSTVDITAASVTAGSSTGLAYTYWTDTSATLVYSSPTAATNGTYYIEGTNAEGCSTIESVSVKVNASYSFTDGQSICKGTTYNWHGTNYSTAGTYYANYTSISSCDSNYTLNLTVNDVDTGITVVGYTITANASSGTFQWVDCDNNYAWISGETGQSFAPAVDGNYAVIVTQGPCSDTSSCTYILTVDIAKYENNSSINVYPNPVSSELNIEINGTLKNTNFEIINSVGQIVSNGTFPGKTVIQTSSLPTGVYLIKLETVNGLKYKEFVKE